MVLLVKTVPLPIPVEKTLTKSQTYVPYVEIGSYLTAPPPS
jgi:hypothetical protein